jgi:hypothetical protein
VTLARLSSHRTYAFKTSNHNKNHWRIFYLSANPF